MDKEILRVLTLAEFEAYLSLFLSHFLLSTGWGKYESARKEGGEEGLERKKKREKKNRSD
ncbi:hypothetical protein HC762_00980 [bacterium]|nr:hypothetical protein [bacterium]